MLRPIKNPLIAFTGYARSGKDVAASALVDSLGFVRVAFGDVIKRQLDPLIRAHLGFSAFTEVDSQKSQIRGVLEQWGDANYNAILAEMMSQLPPRTVNSRLVRIREAEAWVGRGGLIVQIKRPGFGPATQWERDRMEELRETGLVRHVIEESDREKLRAAATELAFA